MEFLKFINYNYYQEKAAYQLMNQFPFLRRHRSDYEYYQVEWFHETNKPFVLILNIIENGMLIRKEWYEYHNNNWNFIGYLLRKDCIIYYKWQVWQRNKNDFPTFEHYLQYIKNRPNTRSDEEIARAFPDWFFSNYHTMQLMK